MDESAIQSAIAKYNSTVTYSAAAGGILGYFNAIEWAAIGGFFIALASFIYDLHHKESQKRRHIEAGQIAAAAMLAEEKRKDAEHALKMDLLRKQLLNEATISE